MTGAAFKVPAVVAKHRGALVKAVAETAHLMFQNRATLDRPIKNSHGNILLAALPEIRQEMISENRRKKGETAKALERRRSDWMQGFLAVWTVQLAFASYRSKAILSPHHETRDDPFATLREIAIAAELITPDYRSKADPNDPGDRVERYTRFMRKIGMLSETKQNREQKPDGKFRATGAGIRRVMFKFLFKCGGALRTVAKRVHEWSTNKAEAERREQEEADAAFHRALRELDQPAPDETLPEAPAVRPGDPDPAIVAAVEDAHPEWKAEPAGWRRVLAEATRIQAEGADTS